jgi:hypothetical protein
LKGHDTQRDLDVLEQLRVGGDRLGTARGFGVAQSRVVQTIIGASLMVQPVKGYGTKTVTVPRQFVRTTFVQL